MRCGKRLKTRDYTTRSSKTNNYAFSFISHFTHRVDYGSRDLLVEHRLELAR